MRAEEQGFKLLVARGSFSVQSSPGHSLGHGQGLLLTVDQDHGQMWTHCQRACEGGCVFIQASEEQRGPTCNLA